MNGSKTGSSSTSLSGTPTPIGKTAHCSGRTTNSCSTRHSPTPLLIVAAPRQKLSIKVRRLMNLHANPRNSSWLKEANTLTSTTARSSSIQPSKGLTRSSKPTCDGWRAKSRRRYGGTFVRLGRFLVSPSARNRVHGVIPRFPTSPP
jgi:hypothetical protein